MITTSSCITRLRRRLRLATLAMPAVLGLALLGSPSAQAKPVPPNLGNGLDKLVTSNLAINTAKAAGVGLKGLVVANGHQYIDDTTAAIATGSLSDAQGRVLVRVTFDGSVALKRARESMASTVASLSITSVDETYRNVGVLNAYVSVDDVPALAQVPGVAAVILEWRPYHNKVQSAQTQGPVKPAATIGETITQLGTYTDQGIIQHKVDEINQFYNPAATLDYEGQNLSIACISNSFAANAAHPASLDVTNNDLPGNASNPVNTTPVFVLLDDTSTSTSDDEGRGMCEIVYKMAPKAKVGFATADAGEVGFANAIRGLAGINSADFPSASTQGFAADVICDDVGYFDEPFYQDGIISGGIEDVAAAGVSYFSSAANDIGINGYESVIRVVPNDPTGSGGLTFATGNQALINTNINLTGVPAGLYAGGFHNFNPNGMDVAQTVNVAANNTVVTALQWNDPYDQNGGVTQGSAIYSNTGTINATTPTVTFNGTSTPPLPTFTAGQGYQIVEAATSGTYDAVVTLIAPDGSTVLTQDTGVNETVNFTATQTGQYQIQFAAYSTTTGSFAFTVYNATITQLVKSDWNLLAFRTDTGAYVAASSLTTNNLASNEPIELGYVNRTSATVTSIQYVFARSNTPTGPRVADHIRYQIPANGRAGYGPQEYFTYNTVTTAGHATSRSCNGTAAYSPFRPNIPENFSSPGPATFYFDKNSNALATPEIRLQPSVAAMDGGNISANEGLAGLGSDSTSDYDSAANFSGTSAAAPHAAACALLVLQAHGGHRSVTPAQMTQLLHSTAFPHDLDPNMSTGSARATGSKINLSFTSDNESNTGTGLNDANSLSVSYVGPSYIKTLVFNQPGTAATGGNVTGGNNGLDTNNTYFSASFPGLVFPAATTSFLVGSGSVGLTTADVTAATSNLAGAPSTTQNYTLTLSFPNNNFTGGKTLNFTISRLIQHTSVLPSGTTAAQYSADLFGGGVLIPEGTVITGGMAFSGTLGDNSTFTGTMQNRIGNGYSKLDGFGFINASAAAKSALPPNPSSVVTKVPPVTAN